MTRLRRTIPPAAQAAGVLAFTAPVFLLAAPQTARAQGNSSLPPIAAPRPLELPKVVQTTLPNGMRLVVLEDHKQPAVWMRLAIAAGSIRDPRDKVGLAEATASLLNKGTNTRSESQIADTVDGLGASLGAGAEEDYLNVSANALSPYTDRLFELMADITLNPTFPDAEFARYKTRALSGYTAALGDPGTVATAVLARAVFGAHPYGDFSSGTPKTLGNLSPADLKTFHGTYFAPNAATLFVVGDITPAQAQEKAAKFFGGWAKKDVPALPAAPTAPGAGADGKPRILLIDRPGASQTEIRVGELIPGYSDPNRIPASVAGTVLGGGSFENRLTKEIRVKRGLSYGAGSGFSRNKEAGQFLIQTFTKNATTGQVVKIALEEVDKLRQTPPPADELRDRKQYLTGTFAVSVATPAGVLSRLVPAVLYGQGPEDLSLYTQRVQAVTAEQVQSTFRSVPPGQMTVVLVGDAKEVQPQVADIGPVTVISQSELDLLSPTLKASGDAATGAAATPASPEALAKGKALLDATIKAHGGDAFATLKTVTFTGKGKLTTPPSLGSTEVPVDSLTLITALPDRSRLEMKTGFGDIAIGSPGGGRPGWAMFGGQTQDLPQDSGGGGIDPFGLLVKAASNASLKVTPLPDGEKPAPTADGKALTGFVVTDEKGQATRVYVEADTNLVRRIEVKTPMGGSTINASGYKDASGIKVPGALQTLVNGQELLNLTFDKVEVNKPVEASIFDKPKG